MSKNESILKRFFVFEGLDGAGTTTQAALLSDYIKSLNFPVMLTCEPTDHAIGKLIRNILGKMETCTPEALAYLYAADRANHIYGENGIEQNLIQDSFVISDRYLYSSLAYQSVNCLKEIPITANSFFPHPELVIYIDTPVELCMDRIASRSNNRDIFEKKSFQEKVYENYEIFLNKLPDEVKLLRIDGRLPIEKILGIIKKYLLENSLLL